MAKLRNNGFLAILVSIALVISLTPSVVWADPGTSLTTVPQGNQVLVVDPAGSGDYASLQEAVDAAEDGATIQLAADLAESTPTVIEGKSLTIDLAGHTLSGENIGSEPLILANNATLSISNGTIRDAVGYWERGADWYYYGAGALACIDTNLTVDGVTFISNGQSTNSGHLADSIVLERGTLNLSNSTFTDTEMVGFGHPEVKCRLATVSIDNCQFTDVYKALKLENCATANISNSSFTGYMASGKKGTYDGYFQITNARDEKQTTAITNCMFSDIYMISNNYMSTIIAIDPSSDVTPQVTISGCTITNNTVLDENGSQTHHIIEADPSYPSSLNLLIEDTIITGNYSNLGTLYLNSGVNATLRNTVIKDNTARGYVSRSAYAGGIVTLADQLVIEDSAVYNNTTEIQSNFTPAKANDVFVEQSTARWPVAIKAPAASDFVDSTDPSYDFSNLVWKDGAVSGFENSPKEKSDVRRFYTITDIGELAVAKINDVLFGSLEEAFAAAEEGDTIEIIDDAVRISVTQPIVVDKNVTLAVEDHNIVYNPAAGVSEPLFSIQDGVTLTVTNNQSERQNINSNSTADVEGGIETGTVLVNDGARLVLVDPMVTDDIELNGTMAVDALQKSMHIILGEGKFVELGEAYSEATYKQAKFTFDLADDVLAALNEGESADVVLIQGGNENLFNGITVTGLANSKVSKKMSEGNIVLHVGDALYIDGVNGNDDADGTTAATAVKSFAEVEKRIAANPKIDTVIVVGTVTVADEQTWTLPEGASLVRGETFKNNLVAVAKDGSLVLKDIVLDGMLFDASAPLIEVAKGGYLEINDGTVLKNNNNRKSGFYCYGGAVLAQGDVVMNGGFIKHNLAGMGGGIFMDGGTFSMPGGTITENETETIEYTNKGKVAGAGGGVMLVKGAQMTMGGGEAVPAITNNYARAQGGGISLGAEYGSRDWYVRYENGQPILQGTKLTMLSGIIDGNRANRSGGGIFVQDATSAYIYGGVISNNTAYGNGTYFSGGGIYVNGIHSLEDFKYEETIASEYRREIALSEKDLIHGYLYIENVEISENTAGWLGGAVAICNVGQTSIGDFSTAIHDNVIENLGPSHSKTSGDNVDVFLSVVSHWNAGYGGNTHPTSYLSNYMIGGGEYDWRNPRTGALVSTQNLYENTTSLAVVSDVTSNDEIMQTAMRGAKVLIRGNYGGSNGGGIGSDGLVTIGSIVPKVDLAVNKTWVEDNEDTRPQAIKYNLYRQAGEDASTKELYKEVVVRIEKTTLDDGTEAVATYAYPCKDGVETGEKLKLADEATYAYTWFDLLKFVPNTNSEIAYIYSIEEDLGFVVGQDDAGNDITMGDLYAANLQQGDETSRTIYRINTQGGVDELAQPVYNWTITNSPKPEPEEPEETTEIEEPEPPANNPPTETPEEPETPNEPAKQETPKQPVTPKTATPAKPASGQAKTGDAAPILPLTALALAAAASGMIAWRSYRRNEE